MCLSQTATQREKVYFDHNQKQTVSPEESLRSNFVSALERNERKTHHFETTMTRTDRIQKVGVCLLTLLLSHRQTTTKNVKSTCARTKVQNRMGQNLLL